jgi:hypothetical protein
MPLLSRAFEGFDGLLLSGGTHAGLPGLVGTIAGSAQLRAVGYLPVGVPHAEGYSDFRVTEGEHDFTVREPLAMWSDILAAGLEARSVHLVACPGGQLTYAEILLARALGARIAWLDPAAELPLPLDDLLPFGAEGVLELPADAMTIRAFLRRSELPDTMSTETQEKIARCLHNEYRLAQYKRKVTGDPALEHWDRLSPYLRQSNTAQANDIPNKLDVVGKRLVEAGQPLMLTGEEIERLAEIEHGRYNVERLDAGWQLGERHLRRLTSPHLKSWIDLGHDVQDYDREAVTNIAVALEDVGWGVTDA